MMVMMPTSRQRANGQRMKPMPYHTGRYLFGQSQLHHIHSRDLQQSTVDLHHTDQNNLQPRFRGCCGAAVT